MAADVAFVTEGLLASGAEMRNFSAGGASESKTDGDALLRISQAFCGLVECLRTSMEEFRDVEHALELEFAGTGSPELFQTSASVELARSELLRVVAGTLKEMVAEVVLDIKGNAGVQKLMPAIQKVSVGKHRAALFQELVSLPKYEQLYSGTANSAPGEEAKCNPSEVSIAKRSVGKGQVVCRHFCDHAEVVDQWLWRNLPEELVELVFAKLPLRLITELRETSKAWHTMSESSNFREACSKSHPLFGLMGFDDGSMLTMLHDIKLKEWLSVDIAGHPGSSFTDGRCDQPKDPISTTIDYRYSMCASGGGLACFIPYEHMTSLPILVCNPLTSMWKALPFTPIEDFENKITIMVQLVVEDNTKWYRVILVICEKIGEVYGSSALFYSSETCVWSTMHSGLVYGEGRELVFGHGRVPYVFDCRTNTLFDLARSASLASIDSLGYSVAKDRLFVLHESDVSGEHCNGFMYLVSEYTWVSSVCDLRRLRVSESPVEVFPDPYKIMLLASPGFVLLIAGNCEERHEDHRQIIGLHNTTTNQWDTLPLVPCHSNFHYERLRSSFMVECRWTVDL